MLRRSAVKRYVDLGKPSERFGIASLAGGWASLVPPLAPFAATFSVVASLLGTFMAGKFPERYAGSRKITYGLLLSLLGMGLFTVESQLFWRWKVDQAYEERVEVTRYRLSLVADALGRYRQETGAYPEVSGIMASKKLLEPKYAPLVPIFDAFDGALSVDSRPEGFTLTATPPPRPRTNRVPPPIVVQGGFQPAPAPPPPPEVLPETPAGGAAVEDGGPPPEGGDVPRPEAGTGQAPTQPRPDPPEPTGAP